MDWIILTGMSGAGKTNALNTLEDLGYLCVDNLPPRLLPSLADIRREVDTPTCVVIDSRSMQDGVDYLEDALAELPKRGVTYKIIFLDSDDATLLKRYKETRRSHPMMEHSRALTIEDAIRCEREKLRSLLDISDYQISTAGLIPSQLKSRLISLLSSIGDVTSRGILVHVTSFGFKKGIPADADIVLDVRCLRNPFYIDELKPQTGLDDAVEEYVMDDADATSLLQAFCAMFDTWIPMFKTEGRAMLTIAVGCTGGQHRSVVFAKRLHAYLSDKGLNVSVSHREINK
jgi:UPF0042 nucleotide-binding protein